MVSNKYLNMEITDIKIDNESLVFIDQDNDEVYNIGKDLLADKMKDGESEWINQLSEKSWVNKSILEQVAQIIKTEFPNNDINWEITNRIIENQD